MEKRRTIRRISLGQANETLKLEATKAMTPTILESVKLLVLMNGGAIVALLSQYKDLHGVIEPRGLKTGCFFFIVGLVLACFSSFFYWMAQAHKDGSLENPRSDNREPPRFILWAPLAMYFGIAAFAVGAGWIIWSMN